MKGLVGGRAVGPFLQHFLLAGPMLGLLASLNAYKLSVESPAVPDAASHHVVREVRSWHGKALGIYYITPRQQLIQECLAFPVGCWMILAIAGLVVTGYRVDAASRRCASAMSAPEDRRTVAVARSVTWRPLKASRDD